MTSPDATSKGGEAAFTAASELVKHQQYSSAATKLRESVRLEADPVLGVRNRVNLGCVMHDLGDDAAATNILEDTLTRVGEMQRIAPANLQLMNTLASIECTAHINLGCALAGSPGVTDREDHFAAALRVNPASAEALYYLGLLSEEAGDHQRALGYLERVLALVPQELRALVLSIRCLVQLGRRQEALARFERLVKADLASSYLGLREVFRCQEGDVFVCTFPRCGTTWMVQLAVSVLFGCKVDYNDHAIFVEGSIATEASHICTIERMAAPRILKMHVPADMFPGLENGSETELQVHGKVLYVVRNPKDALVSLRHHHANNTRIAWRGDWDEWVDEWLAGNRSAEYGGTYFEHVRLWWHLSRRHPQRVRVVYFEDMKADLGAVVASVASFVGRETSPEEVVRISERCAFAEMQSRHKVDDDIRERVNPEHFRQGEVGGWRDVLTDAQARRVDAATWKHLREELREGLRIHDLGPEE